MRTPASLENHFSAAFLLFFSGVSGFLLGGYVYGTWQLAVESGQAIAGLVPYLHDHPFYI